MADISKIKTLDGQTHDIKVSTARSTAYSKSTIVANTTLAGTEAELSGLQIDGTKFKLGGGGNIQVLTSAQYAALSQQEKMADIIYVITDDETEIELINDFIRWDNPQKDKALFELVNYCIDYASAINSIDPQDVVSTLKNKKLYFKSSKTHEKWYRFVLI